MKQFILSIFLSLATFTIHAQNRTVTGTIVDETGEALIGGSVFLKGFSNIGAICDIDGKYSLTFDSNEPEPTLIFSYIGFTTQEIKVGQNSTVNVTMRNNNIIIDEPYIQIYTPQMKQRDMSAAVVKEVRHRYIQPGMKCNNGKVPGLYMQCDDDLFTMTANIRSGIGNIGGEVRTIVDGIVDAPYNYADLFSLTAIKAPHAEVVASTATAPGGLLQLVTKDYYTQKSLTADAQVGFLRPIALVPHNDKNKYNDNLTTGMMQHYGIQFSDFFADRFKMYGSVYYDQVNGTVGNTEGERFNPRLLLEYQPQRWVWISQTVYYDWQEQQRDWLYNEDIVPFKNNTRREMFSATTVKLSPWNWLTTKSVYTYDWIDSQGDRINNNHWRSGYRDYFDFRNQENSLVDRWMWDNTISTTHKIDYYHELLFLGAFTRDETTIKTLQPTVSPQGEWNRNKTTDNLLLRGTYNYNYGSRIFNASIRQLSSSLPTKNNAKVHLPSFATGWKITNEEFIQDMLEYDMRQILSFLKISAGWGQSAHIGLNLPVTMTDGNGYPDFVCSDLKWQVTTQTDASMELSLFNNRLSLSTGYYHKATNHVLENRPISSNGAINIYSGDAQVLNKGWEFDAGFSNGRYNLLWDTRVSLTINHSSLKNAHTTNSQLLLGNVIAPKYNYGVSGNVHIKDLVLSMHINGATDMYIPANAFAAPFYPIDYAKINYIALKSVQASYMLNLRRIAYNLKTEFYINTENLLYKTNASLKDARINYAAYPINQMVSVGLKIHI